MVLLLYSLGVSIKAHELLAEEALVLIHLPANEDQFQLKRLVPELVILIVHLLSHVDVIIIVLQIVD